MKGRPLPSVAPEINATLYTGPTLIKPGDILDVRFPRMTGWDQLSVVRLDGRVSFPLIGEVIVGGLTIDDVNRIVDERYQAVPEQPEVDVNIGNPTLQGREGTGGIAVSGEVGQPGVVQLFGERITLIEALGRAGGPLKESALLANTLLVRRAPDTGRYYTWRIDARTEHWGMGDPVLLQPNDVVFVPNTPIDDVNIWIQKYVRNNLPTEGIALAAAILAGSN